MNVLFRFEIVMVHFLINASLTYVFGMQNVCFIIAQYFSKTFTYLSLKNTT